MKKYIFTTIASLFMLSYTYAAAENKTICKDVVGKDGKVVLSQDGKPKQTCRTIKVHQKLEGTAVPTKTAPVSKPAGFNADVQKRQQQLISVGAKITADGVTGPSTRKAEAEFGKLIPAANKK
jgi:hypothetical protein